MRCAVSEEFGEWSLDVRMSCYSRAGFLDVESAYGCWRNAVALADKGRGSDIW